MRKEARQRHTVELETRVTVMWAMDRKAKIASTLIEIVHDPRVLQSIF